MTIGQLQCISIEAVHFTSKSKEVTDLKYKLREAVIELTKTCNLCCSHCGSGCNGGRDPSELTATEWIQVLGDLKDFDLKKIVFSGGEPTLKKGFDQIIAFCDQINLRFGIISNGFNFSAKLLEALSEHRPFAIGISLDGMKKTHNIIRNNKSSWNRAIESISKLQELEIPVCISTTVNRLNYQEIIRMAQFFDLAEINTWQIQLAMPMGRLTNELAIDEDIFKSVCEDIFYIRQTYPNVCLQAADCFCLAPPGMIRDINWTNCLAGISAIGIDSCGNVMPCLSMRGADLCGNLLERKIADIWRSDRFDFNRDFDITSLGSNCLDCEYGLQCQGGCNSQSFSHFGHFHDSPFCYHRSFCKINQPEREVIV